MSNLVVWMPGKSGTIFWQLPVLKSHTLMNFILSALSPANSCMRLQWHLIDLNMLPGLGDSQLRLCISTNFAEGFERCIS